MATLTVTATEDYRDGVPSVAGTEKIEFITSASANAFFNSVQFGGAGILDTVAIVGDGNSNFVHVFTPSDTEFSAAGWTFSDWSANDRVLLEGTSAAEKIIGSSQSNSINGGGGADVLTGGDADDMFRYTNATELVAGEELDGKDGTDELSLGFNGTYTFSQVSLTNIEILSAFFGATIVLTGGQIGAGAITEIVASSSTSALIVNGASVNLSAVTFTFWTAGVDTVIINGTAASNLNLVGSNQNDTIDGGDGVDQMTGGLGSDIYIVDQAGDIVDETGGGGTDTVHSQVNFSLADAAHVVGIVENLTLFGGAVSGTGNGLANTVTGNGNANTLDGGGGGDILRGLGGNDTYFVDDANDVADESAGGSSGDDIVSSSVSFSFADGVHGLGALEILILTGSALNGTGNGGNNTIVGNANANRLDGGGGVDTMVGGAGDDIYVLDNAGDVADENGGSGIDTIEVAFDVSLNGAGHALGGAIENITLIGSAVSATGNGLANVITGNAGANVLDGMGANDTLVGLAGADKFSFSSALTKKSVVNLDTIIGFETGVDDVQLDKSIFKKLTLNKNGSLDKDAFFKGNPSKTDAEDRILYNKQSGVLSYDKDGDGNAKAIAFAFLDTSPDNLKAKDFLIVA